MPFSDWSMKSGAAPAAALSLAVSQLAPLPLPLPGMAPAAAQYGSQSVRINCYSNGNRTETCNLPRNTQSVSFLGPDRSGRCREGVTWRRNGDRLRVWGGCGGTFEAIVYNSGGGWDNNNRGFAGQLECRSDNNRFRRCDTYTDNRVEMLRQFSSTSCSRGRNWGYDRNSIWVDEGCQARFGYGYGNVQGDTSGGNSGGGSDTGAIIGGVALAAGLIALLAAAGKSSNNSSNAGKVAQVEADRGMFPSAARASGEACLQEAARQVGSTGGTKVRLDELDSASRSGEGWMILARVTVSYPQQTRQMSMDCRATGSTVKAFELR